MIDRRTLVGALASGTLASPFAAGAQPRDKVWRIGYIGLLPAGASPEGDKFLDANFLQVLSEHGFVVGKNLVFERRGAAGRYDQLAATVTELIGLHVDVLVALATPATRAAKAATTTIPIVMLNVSDPVERGLLASLARPGGNVTGMADFGTELLPKRLELLKAAAPRIARVAQVMEDDGRFVDAATASATNERYDAAARGLGMSLVRVRLNSPQDFESATAMIVQERADALLIDGSSTNYALRRELGEFSVRHRLPSVVSTNASDAGGLIYYGTDQTEVFRKAAIYVVKILNGARPTDLAVEQPTKFELIFNLKIAKAIGLTIPQAFLLRADRVIE